MDAHAVPSGGDWALDRAAAVFLQGTEGVRIEHCTFERLDGEKKGKGQTLRVGDEGVQSAPLSPQSTPIRASLSAGVWRPAAADPASPGSMRVYSRSWRRPSALAILSLPSWLTATAQALARPSSHSSSTPLLPPFPPVALPSIPPIPRPLPNSPLSPQATA
jgi:hypothetical protein